MMTQPRPAGVRAGKGSTGPRQKPPVYLRPGNVLRTWIEGVGECVNHCVAEKAD